MDLILYSCKARLNSYFRHKKMPRVLLLALCIVLSAFYAWLITFLLQQASEGGLNMDVSQMLGYTNLLLLSFTILRGFFPAYIPKADFINRIYPIKPLKRFWTELIVELVSPFYFVLLNFLLLLCMMSPDYTLLHLAQSFLVFLTAHITRRSLQ